MSVAFARTVLAVACFVGAPLVACSSEEHEPAHAACDDAKCVEGNRCVDGVCSLLCARHTDCPEERGSHCATGVADDGSGDVLVCRPGAVPKTPGGYGSPCGLHLDADCNTAEGFVCPARQYDVDAFCTKPGACATDADCPSDMVCGSLRRTACVSLATCAAQTDCERLPGYTCTDLGAGMSYCVAPGLCHTQPDDCPLGVACAPLPGTGATYENVRACVPRRECAPCDIDADCADSSAACIEDSAGEGFCAKPCDIDGTSCDPGSECRTTPKGDRCVPRAGTCHGDGSPCAPCRDDRDCGPGSCEVVEETRERYCRAPCADGCPNAPGGGEMLCCTTDACGTLANTCVPVPHANPYPRTSSGCWLTPCVKNGDCAEGELCDVRELSLVSDTELLTECGAAGVCRPAHDPTDAVNFQIHERVCDCDGTQYMTETELAMHRDAAFRGCCFSVTSATTGNTYACPTP